MLGDTTVLEEDLKTNWFSIDSYAIKDGEDCEYETGSGDIKINTMPKI